MYIKNNLKFVCEDFNEKLIYVIKIRSKKFYLFIFKINIK